MPPSKAVHSSFKTITMKPFLLMLGFGVLIAANTRAQALEILLVDDSKDDFSNTAVIAAALTQGGYDFDTFDAPGAANPLTAEDLGLYDLVIWHTSTDGAALDLWSRADADNEALIAYLENGGNLWLIGNDFLYDRYGAAAVDFTEGDFPYDFLGIAQYAAQAYGDDGGLGVPAVAPADDQPIEGIDNITWQFSTLWWADVITPRAGAVSIYNMSGNGYLFNGQASGLWYDNDVSKCLTFGFDLSLAGTQAMVDATVSSVIEFFRQELISYQEEVTAALPYITISPNPAAEAVQLTLELADQTFLQIDVFNALGQRVDAIAAPARMAPGIYTFIWAPAATLPNGNYGIRIRTRDKVVSRQVILSR